LIDVKLIDGYYLDTTLNKKIYRKITSIIYLMISVELDSSDKM